MLYLGVVIKILELLEFFFIYVEYYYKYLEVFYYFIFELRFDSVM